MREVFTDSVVDGSLSNFADNVARKVPVLRSDEVEKVREKVEEVSASYTETSMRMGLQDE